MAKKRKSTVKTGRSRNPADLGAVRGVVDNGGVFELLVFCFDQSSPMLIDVQGCLLRPEVVGPSSGNSIVVLGSFVLILVSIPFVPY